MRNRKETTRERAAGVLTVVFTSSGVWCTQQKKMGKKKQNKRAVGRRELVFDEEMRREYLTGFHKRKVQRRKAAVEEIKRKIKEEQKKMKEERHKEYMRMLKEREDALEEADELERLVTSKSESVQYDHPNHTVTVTTISDLDLSGVGLLPVKRAEEEEAEEQLQEDQPKSLVSAPRKAGDPLLSKRICSLTASLHSRSQRKSTKRPSRTQDSKKQVGAKVTGRTSRVTGRTTKAQRRRQTGKSRRNRD
ncbi:nucleolar protein 12 isoform X2 [Spea bombifrons]|uniref:nucleolar protein 12 isoform X2 n=1 Tax=Spea bombifrons TaxID=233779 RepID=UPI0023495883|nr:nucleolar protein 12 isoform X2 [Spea bombifrons]